MYDCTRARIRASVCCDVSARYQNNNGGPNAIATLVTCPCPHVSLHNDNFYAATLSSRLNISQLVLSSARRADCFLGPSRTLDRQAFIDAYLNLLFYY
jgi:hypothetical protein